MHELIVDFMNRFYGYGNTQGRYWFIGMEEGCGPNWETDVLPRFVNWHNRGNQETEHLRDYHASFGVTRHWLPNENNRIAVQFTWKRLMETILIAQNGCEWQIAPGDISAYQSDQLGTSDGDNCLLELLPLPSPNIGEFAYAHLANAEYPFFARRALYRRHIINPRINHIREMIEHGGAAHVVLYGTTYNQAWNQLVLNAQWEVIEPEIERCQLFNRHIWRVPHPAKRPLRGDLYRTLGCLMYQTDQGLL